LLACTASQVDDPPNTDVGSGGLGGSAGDVGSGGVMGVAGAPAGAGGEPDIVIDQCAASSKAGGDGVVDDLEDGDNAIISHDGRAGYWFTYHDGTQTGSLMLSFPADDGADDTLHSMHFAAKGYTGWGAGFGVTVNGSNPMCGHDASIYEGFRFWAKATGRHGPFGVGMAIPTRDTAATDGNGGGGTCVPGSAPYTGCGYFHGHSFTFTTEWQEYEIKWEDLVQQGGGQSFPFSSKRILSILFQTPTGDPVVVDGTGGAGGVANTGGGENGGGGGDTAAAGSSSEGGATGTGGAGSTPTEPEYDYEVSMDQLEFF
jgi:hypothetical protein